jgi:cytochrome subunit of sulfide dehydrogenase
MATMIATRLLVAGLIVCTSAAFAATPEPPPGASACSGCHPSSAGRRTSVPALDGRNAADIVAAMQAFRSGQRPATVMDRIAKGFSDAEVEAIAAWYADRR